MICTRLLDTMPAGVTASAGIAQWNGEEDQAMLYRRCDEALYAAKDSGRDCARIAP
jgi:PleD family two-component response regulator